MIFASRHHPIFLVLRVCLGVFFLWSGGVKLLDVNGFVTAVGNFQLVFPPFDALVAYVLPWLEVFSGFAVLAGVLYRGGLWMIVLQLTAFVVVSASAAVRGLNINCGCFGNTTSEPTDWPTHFVLLASLMVVAGVLLWESYQKRFRLGRDGVRLPT